MSNSSPASALRVIDDTQPTEWTNYPNGLLGRRASTPHPHRPEAASTCQLAVPYKPMRPAARTSTDGSTANATTTQVAAGR
jgi:hypothetical protein